MASVWQHSTWRQFGNIPTWRQFGNIPTWRQFGNIPHNASLVRWSRAVSWPSYQHFLHLKVALFRSSARSPSLLCHYVTGWPRERPGQAQARGTLRCVAAAPVHGEKTMGSRHTPVCVKRPERANSNVLPR